MTHLSDTNQIKKLLHRGKYIFYFLFFGGILYFFGNNILQNWQEIKNYSFEIQPFFLIYSFVLYFLFYFGLTLGWKYILGKNSIPFYEILRINTLSWISKYLPGKVAIIMTKVYPLEKLGVEKKESFLSVAYEQIFQIIASLIVSLPFLFIIVSPDITHTYLIWGVTSLILFLLIIEKNIFYFGFKIFLKIIGKAEIEKTYFLSSKKIFLFLGLYTIITLIKWLAFSIFALSFSWITFEMIPYLLFTWIFAWVVGILAIFTPNWLGVREWVMVFLLSQIMTPELALILSLGSRIWSSIWDGLIWLLLLKHKKWKKMKF